MERTARMAAFLLASSAGGMALVMAMGIAWHETAAQPIKAFVEGRPGPGSWASIEMADGHFSGRARERPLYDATFFSRRLEQPGFQYPPTSILVMRLAGLFASPRGFLEVFTWLWIPMTAVLVALLDRRLSTAAATSSRRERWARGALAFFATLTFYPLMRAYAGGHVEAWVTGLFAAALLSWVCGRAALAGALVALMAAIKPQAAFLVLWAAVRGQWRFVGGFAAVAVPLLAASIAGYGVSPHLEYLDVLAFLLRRGEAYIANQSVNGLLHRALWNGQSLYLFLPGTTWRGHFPPYHAAVHAGTIVTSLVLMGAALWPPRVGAARAWNADFCIAAVTAVIASPIAWEHDYGILLPIAVVLLPGLEAWPKALCVLAASYFVAANPWPVTRGFATTAYTPLQSHLLFAALGMLALLYRVHARAAVPVAGVAGARGLRARLDWRPTAAQAALAVQGAGAFLLAAALVAYPVAWDRTQAGTDVYTLWDPEFFYMLNSLLPFEGHLYSFVDHPGTPVEVIGTVLLLLLWPLASLRSQSLAELCVFEPWVFLALGHLVLTAASVVVVVLLVRRALPLDRWDGVVLSLAAGCAFYVLHSHAMQTLAYWSHNSFNFPGGGLLTVLLLLRLREDPLPRPRWLAGMGVAAGGLAAVQLYMGAWTIGIAVAVAAAALLHGQGWRGALRSALIVGAGSVAGFVLATLPIAPLYPKFLRWISALIRGQGIYGAGPQGFSMRALGENAVTVIAGHPAVFAALGTATLAIAAAAVRDRRSLRLSGGAYAVALGIAVQSAVLALAIFKHPGSLYLLSLAALAPVQIAIAFACWRDRGGASRAACLIAGSAIVFVFVCWYPLFHVHQASVGATTRRNLDRVEEALGRKEADGKRQLRLWMTGTDSTCFGLWVANNDPARTFSPEISRRCPRDGAAFFGFLGYPRDWDRLDPGSVSPVLVASQGAFDTERMAEWGRPEPTGVDTLFFGPYVIVPFGLDRLTAPR